MIRRPLGHEERALEDTHPPGTRYGGSGSFLYTCQCLEDAAKYNATSQLEASFCSTQVEVVTRQGGDLQVFQVLGDFCILQCWAALSDGSSYSFWHLSILPSASLKTCRPEYLQPLTLEVWQLPGTLLETAVYSRAL